MAGLLGGLPSAIALTPSEMDRSIRSIAHLVPGNSRITSLWGRRAAGAAAHMAISLTFALLYPCAVRPRLRRPSVLAAAAFGGLLWLVNIKLMAPQAMRDEDVSLALPDHLCWAVVVEMCLRKMASSRGAAE